MLLNRRRLLLASAALPAACAMPRLPELRVAPAEAPASAAAGMRAPKRGQHWTYAKGNWFNGEILDRETVTVGSVGDHVVLRIEDDKGRRLPEEIHAPWGQVLVDPHWDAVALFAPAVPLWPARLAPGATESGWTHYRVEDGSYRHWWNYTLRATGWERIRVAAGEFVALRCLNSIRFQHPSPARIDNLRWDWLWFAPEVGRFVVRESYGEYRLEGDRDWSPSREDRFRWELVDWS